MQQIKSYMNQTGQQAGWCINFAATSVYDHTGYYTPENAIGLPSDFITLQPGEELKIHLRI